MRKIIKISPVRSRTQTQASAASNGISKYWLGKAILIAISLILAVNLGTGIHQVQAASLWEDLFNPVSARVLFSFINLSDSGPRFLSTGGDALMSANILQPKIIKATITAYSSTPDQTKADDPFTMASGKHVYDGAVAANFLDFGTEIKIPEVFGDKIFVVEDRMNKRFSDRIDIWFPTRAETIEFGKQELEVVIL